MAILIDGSTPAIAVQATGTTATVVTASFTPPVGSVLLIRYSANTIDPNDPGNPTITDSLGTHLAYTSWDIGKRPDSPLAEGQVATWTAPIPPGWTPGTSMTITVTNGAASPNRHAALAVSVITGADQSNPVGTHGKNSSLSAASIAQTVAGTRAGSRSFLVSCDWADIGAETAGSGTTLEGSADVAANFVYGFFRRSSNDGVPGVNSTINVTIPGTSTSLRWAWVEMLPIQDAGGSGRLPPYLLLQLLSWKLRLTEFQISLQIAAETGTSAVAILATGVAVKVAPQTGRVLLIALAAGADRKVAPETGTGQLVITATGAESTVAARAQTGTAVLLIRTAGTEVKVARPTSSVSLPLISSGADRKVAPETGTSELLVRTSGAEVHQQAQTGRTVVFPRTSGQETNRVAMQTGRAVVALTSSGVGAKKTAEVGTTQLVVTTSGAEATGTSRPQTGRAVLVIGTPGAARKTAVLTGSAMLVLTGAGSDVKRAPETGRANLVVSTSGLEAKRVAAAGRATISLAAYATSGAPPTPGSLTPSTAAAGMASTSAAASLRGTSAAGSALSNSAGARLTNTSAGGDT